MSYNSNHYTSELCQHISGTKSFLTWFGSFELSFDSSWSDSSVISGDVYAWSNTIKTSSSGWNSWSDIVFK